MGCGDSKESVAGDNWNKSNKISSDVAPNLKTHSSNLTITDALQDIQDDDAELENAATKIQSTFRGHRARRQLQQQNTATGPAGSQIDLNDPAMTAAATTIQASFRGHQVRRNDVLHQREEDFYREMEDLHTKQRPSSRTEDEMTAAATKIQASFRGHQVRRNDVLHQREEDFYREMEQLHTKERPSSRTEDGR